MMPENRPARLEDLYQPHRVFRKRGAGQLYGFRFKQVRSAMPSAPPGQAITAIDHRVAPATGVQYPV